MPEIVTAALVREGRVLLVHRSPNKHVYPNVWGLAGGHIDAGETELAALAREVHEELGVQIATDSAIHLCRLDIGRAEESVRLSAWIISEWEGTPTTPLPTSMTRSIGSGRRSCRRSPTNPYARR